MGWVIGISVAAGVAAWLFVCTQPYGLEHLLPRLPEPEPRLRYRDFETIERDEPMEGDPEYGQPGAPWGMFNGEDADGRMRAHWLHSSEANAPPHVRVGGEYLCRVGNERDWRRVWFRVLKVEGCSRGHRGWCTLRAVVEPMDRAWGTRSSHSSSLGPGVIGMNRNH